MNTPDPRLEWIRQYAEGIASEETTKQLEQALREDAAFRKLFLEYLNVELALSAGTILSPEKTRGKILSFPVAHWRPLVAWAAAAAVLAASLAALWFATGRRESHLPTAQPSLFAGYVATLTAQEDAVWHQQSALLTGQRLMAGPMRLQRGRAVIRFDGGARVAVAAPADLALESPGGVRVVSGRVAVQATEEAVGFRVFTPEGMAVDLGTEFVVAVNPSGGTECQVLEGEVEWYSRDGRQRLATLNQGEARQFRAGEIKIIESQTEESVRRLFSTPVGASEGKLLAYEPFDYDGSDTPAESLAGGFGWQSPWRGRFIPTDEVDQDPRMRVRSDASLIFPGLAVPQGGRFIFHEPKQWRLRALATPVDLGRDGIYYLSYLARRPIHPPPRESPYGRMLITLRSSTNYWAHCVSFAITLANRPLIIADGNNRASDRILPSNETLLVVCKLVASRHGPDQLLMKVYEPRETPEMEETTAWTVVSQNLNYDAAFDLLILGNTGGTAWELDELRYGTSWDAVLPRQHRAVASSSPQFTNKTPQPRRDS